MQYKRSDIKGGTYFFTVNLIDRKSTLLIDQINHLKAAINNVKQNHPFKINAMVTFPEHIHAIWTLPPDDSNYAKRWMLIKSTFSRKIPKKKSINKSRLSKRERGIWQRRYWEHTIKDEKDLINHIDYIHYTPIKHQHVKTPTDWPHSTIHHYIKTGRVEPNWGSDIKPVEIKTGKAE